MKKLLLLFSLVLCVYAGSAQGQMLPYINTMTIIPQSPKAGDKIKIVTHVTTPNQSGIVDKNHTITSNPNEIKLRACYWDGMLTALDDFIDTFAVGQLPAGIYTISHKAYLSSTQQHCTPTDSNMVVKTMTVAVAPSTVITTGIEDLAGQTEIAIYPNPARNILHVTNGQPYVKAVIYAAHGAFLKEQDLSVSTEIDIQDLPPGLYFVRFSGKERSRAARFVKTQ